MRLLFIPFLLAALAFSQDPVGPKAESKALDKETFYHLEAVDAKIEALAARYQIAQYRAQLEPLIEEKNKIVVAQCASVGVPEKEIDGRCRVGTKEKDAPTGLIQWVPADTAKSPRVDSKPEKK